MRAQDKRSWLRCEIYLTSKCHSEAELVDERGMPYAASTPFGPTSGDQSSSKRVVARIALTLRSALM